MPVPGLAGLDVETASGMKLSLVPRLRRAHGEAQARAAARSLWVVLGASRGESGILGEGIRQALLRDRTYGPALTAACEMLVAGDRDAASRTTRRRPARRSARRPRRRPAATSRSPAARRRATAYKQRRRDGRRLVGRDALVRRRALRGARRRALQLPVRRRRCSTGSREDEGGPEVHRMRGERGPHGGADDYERELRDALGEQLPRLDLVLLGLGLRRARGVALPGKRGAGGARPAWPSARRRPGSSRSCRASR